jgi:hypothetical protein
MRLAADEFRRGGLALWYSPSVAHRSRQHLLHQHVSRLDTNADHTRQRTHHCVWSIIGHALQTLQASILDLPDVITD